MNAWQLDDDRCFNPDPTRRSIARELYKHVRALPLICPHGHVDPALLADADARFGSPAELLITPDHYVTRMLHSQGVGLADLGVPTRDGSPYERDPRAIWQRFAERFDLFRGTPTGLWLAHELIDLFGVEERLGAANAQQVYDQIAGRLAAPDYTPRALWQRFGIATLCTTDAATDDLLHHRALTTEGWGNMVRPTFRPDALCAIDDPLWKTNLELLEARIGSHITTFAGFIEALARRRALFRQRGAVATDHGVATPYTTRLTAGAAEAIFTRALRGGSSAADAGTFGGHMLIEMAAMSAEDGLVMQIHAGSLRNHHPGTFQRFGTNVGADIPLATEWTRNLAPLLQEYGTHPNLRLILFTLDESSYSRELAPLAGFYPAVLLGPPWWFFDSVNGMRRYFTRVVETAGLANTAGFNDDTRAFAAIPARHDLWRRVACDWLAELCAEHLLELDDAHLLAYDCAIGLAVRAYRLEDSLSGSAAGSAGAGRLNG